MKILFVAAECTPFAKTGGLADVVGSLPIVLADCGHDVRIVMPKYKRIKAKLRPLGKKLSFSPSAKSKSTRLWISDLMGKVPVYFIDHPAYFNRTGIYGVNGQDYLDNDERFIFFSRASLEVSKLIGFKPDIVHLHDWHAGLVPVYIKAHFNRDSFFNRTATVLTIHNMAYQGNFPKKSLSKTGLVIKKSESMKFCTEGKMSFLKAGLTFSDFITTVSPHYAQEVMEIPRYGCGMGNILRKQRKNFVGILNGLDTKAWDPMRDPYIRRHYGRMDLHGKRVCKKDIQRVLGLDINADIPLIGMVTRIDHQKGIDMALDALKEFLPDKVQFVILGQGDKSLMSRIAKTAQEFRGKMALNFKFNEPLAHKIYAGSDIFLMPSRFEPCGLTQLIAMRFGTVPLVTPTGGLVDTVKPVRKLKGKSLRTVGTGFMSQDISVESIKHELVSALELFRMKREWRSLCVRMMKQDFAWNQRVQEYENMYRSAIQRKENEA